MKDGVPTGKYQDFMTGFVVSDKEVWGRPSGVEMLDDGSLLVVDDVTGEIWRASPTSNDPVLSPVALGRTRPLPVGRDG